MAVAQESVQAEARSFAVIPAKAGTRFCIWKAVLGPGFRRDDGL
jgi:hypothetical protein